MAISKEEKIVLLAAASVFAVAIFFIFEHQQPIPEPFAIGRPCDLETPCPNNYDCYTFEDADGPICWPSETVCERCESGNCRVAESYPMRVFCE